MLAEVDAKRQIIDVCAAEIAGNVNPSAIGNAEDILQLMALPYADHPDCRQEWKP